MAWRTNCHLQRTIIMSGIDPLSARLDGGGYANLLRRFLYFIRMVMSRTVTLLSLWRVVRCAVPPLPVSSAVLLLGVLWCGGGEHTHSSSPQEDSFVSILLVLAKKPLI